MTPSNSYQLTRSFCTVELTSTTALSIAVYLLTFSKLRAYLLMRRYQPRQQAWKNRTLAEIGNRAP